MITIVGFLSYHTHLDVLLNRLQGRPPEGCCNVFNEFIPMIYKYY